MIGLSFFWEATNFSDSYQWILKLLSLHGMEPIVICPDMVGRSKTLPIFATVRDAYDAYSDHTWIWLDHRAEKFLDELEHPEDNVVYAVGSDYTGFDFVGEGEKVRLRIKETFAPMVIPMVCYDRILRTR